VAGRHRLLADSSSGPLGRRRAGPVYLRLRQHAHSGGPGRRLARAGLAAPAASGTLRGTDPTAATPGQRQGNDRGGTTIREHSAVRRRGSRVQLPTDRLQQGLPHGGGAQEPVASEGGTGTV